MKNPLAELLNFSLSGRLSRKAFWICDVFLLLLQMVLYLILGALMFTLNVEPGVWLVIPSLLIFLMAVPIVTIEIRRLHDIGKSAWWLLWCLVPYVGAIVLFVLFVQKGDPVVNKYGPPPDAPVRNKVYATTEPQTEEYEQLEIKFIEPQAEHQAPVEVQAPVETIVNRSGSHVPLIVLSVACAILTALCVFQCVENKKLSKTNDETNAKYQELKSEYREIENQLSDTEKKYDNLWDDYLDDLVELDFWRSYAVITTTTGSKYHTYDCPHLDGRDFYIYNIDNAIYKGYESCRDCIDN